MTGNISSVEHELKRRVAIKEWHDKYEILEQEALKLIDGYIAEGGEESYNAIYELFDSELPLEEFKTRNEMSYVINAVNIYCAEQEAGADIYIFDLADSLVGLINIMNQLRFLIWEMEFEQGAVAAGAAFCQYVKDSGASVQLVLHIVKNTAFDTYKAAMLLADGFEQEKQYKHLLYMLLLASEAKPGDEGALTRLAGLYCMSGNEQLANDCINSIDRAAVSRKQQEERGKEGLEEIFCVEDKEESTSCPSDISGVNSKKIAFIMCTNDAEYEAEAIRYINALDVPEGCEIEILSVWDAKSMTSGYNEGMTSTDAKYKVYLHQDVFLTDKKLIYRMLDIFMDKSVGMIGVAGAVEMPENKVMWCGERIGWIYNANAYGVNSWKLGEPEGAYQTVETIDGMLMITQYDIPWRDDICDKWDMYDVSQSLEFARAGYRVVVPHMRAPWCLHDDGFMNLKNYYGELDKIKKEYYNG